MLRARARPLLAEIAGHTGETAYLAFAAGDQYLCADAIESSLPLHLTVSVGEREKLVGTAIGHALIADDDALADRLAASDPLGWREHAAEVTQARERGFALDEDAFHPGVSCVAVAFGRGAAIGVAGPSARLPHERLVEIAGHLRALIQTGG